MDFFSLPQLWLIIGLVMLFAELVSVTLVFIFFAIAAFITSLLAASGIVNGWEYQLIIFSVLSVASTLVLRKPAKQWVNKSEHKDYNEYAGETAMVIKDIPADGDGRIFYRGAEWLAASDKKVPIVAGSKVTIIRADGIRLIVEEA